MRFGATCRRRTGLCSSMTIWPHLGPDLGFLQDSGYAVIRFALAGGGEVTADGDPDFLGQRGPLVVEPSRIVMRTCAAPKEFLPAPVPTTVRRRVARRRTPRRGDAAIDLALVLDTGVGPLVLSRTAWQRVVAALRRSARARRPRPSNAAGRRAARRDLADPDPRDLVDHPEVRARRISRPGPRRIPAPASSWPARAGWSRCRTSRPGRHEPGSDDGVHATVRRGSARARQGPEQRGLPGADRADPRRHHRRRFGRTCRVCASICARRSPRSTA